MASQFESFRLPFVILTSVSAFRRRTLEVALGKRGRAAEEALVAREAQG